MIESDVWTEGFKGVFRSSDSNLTKCGDRHHDAKFPLWY